MKRIIRLQESELKRIISETVKNALNELAPETYSNAAMKAYDDGDIERYENFKDATFDAYNKKHNINPNEKEIDLDKMYNLKNDFLNTRRHYKDGKWRDMSDDDEEYGVIKRVLFQ